MIIVKTYYVYHQPQQHHRAFIQKAQPQRLRNKNYNLLIRNSLRLLKAKNLQKKLH